MARFAHVQDGDSISELISLSEAKAYLRVDHTTDNAYITELIKIARLQVRLDTNQALVATDVKEYFTEWPNDNVFYLQYNGKLGNTIVIKYYDTTNTQITLTQNTDYIGINYMGLPRVQMLNTFSLYDRDNAIEITYEVSPEDTEAIQTLKIAMYMLIQHYYDNRSPVSYLKVDEMPLGYKNIIAQYKNYTW